MTYRELLEKLKGLDEAQLDAPVTLVAKQKPENEEDTNDRFFALEGPVSLEISSCGLMATPSGVVEDYLGCLPEDELEVRTGCPFLKSGTGQIPTNGIYA